MNILLVPTNQLNCDLHVLNIIPGLGLLQLAASCEKRKIACDIINLSHFNIFSGENCDTIFNAVTDKILSHNPDVVGFSTLITNSIIALELCRKLKSRNSSVFTILGGPGVSHCARGIIRKFPFIDAIIRGEADNAFPEFIQQLQNKKEIINVKGLVWRRNGDVADNGWPDPIENLDDLPLLSYDTYFALNKDQLTRQFLDGVRSAARIEIGRGCPYNCTFCSTSRFFKRKYRLKSVDRVIKEILYTKNKLDCTYIQFVHDLLTLNNSYIERLCAAIQKYAPSLKWYCESRIDTINSKLLKKMVDAGCDALFFGIEAGSKRMQKILRKNLDLTILNDILNSLKQLKIHAVFSFVIGFPEERKPDLEKILSLAMRAKFFYPDKIEIQFHYLRFDPGSDIYIKNKEKLKYNDFCAPFQNGANLPYTCTRLKEIMKNNPELFPTDFYIPNPDISNENLLKFSYMENFLNTFMNKSLWFAYTILGEKLPKGIMRDIDKITLPLFKVSVFKNISKMAESISSLVHNMLKDTTCACEMFNALSKYEIAVLEIRYDNKPIKIIDVFYNPQIIINELYADTVHIKSWSNNKKLLHYIISRDKKSEKIKCREIPEGLISFVKNA